MRTTKKIVSAVLAVCMLASTSALSGFAATTDSTAIVGANTPYSNACEAIDSEYSYSGNDLGATYTKESTTFKVWSPTATSVQLNRYATGSDSEEGAADLGTYTMEQVMDGDSFTGVWAVTVEGDLVNTYYTYTITAVPTTGGNAVTNETQDIYSVATGVNGERSMVCDLDSTDPEGWENDTHILLDNVTESSVWEIHVKDFSYDEASGVSEENRGKYLAFTEDGTTLNNEGEISTCIDYLKELGITTVQINPFYDFASVNEEGSDSQFNWGYDPQNYNVPEGSYSSNPYDGNVRITECKQMIQALHNAGISVVMDVVYNHTYSTDSCFQNTVPNYYYRMTAAGKFSDGSGCGNEMASERAMFREYLINSCRYWVDEYHIDGFRFDLMGLIDVEAMNAIRDNLDEVDTRVYMWGEGWTGGTSVYPVNTYTGEKFYPATQANAALLSDRIAYFNDAIRDNIKGSVFDITSKGLIQGAKTSTVTKGIYYGVRANVIKNVWQASAPSQCVTYASCHDNATLYDQIIASTGLAEYGERSTDAVKMNKLASAILYTSQGVTFSLAGEEMGRTKNGDTNSYASSATLNMIKWNNIVDYADLVSYYKGMIQIKSHFTPLVTDDVKYSNDDYYTFNNNPALPATTIAFTIANDQPGEWSKMAVIYNGATTATSVTLKDTSVTDWVIIANGESAGLENLGEVTGSTFSVPASSAIVAVEKSSFEAAAYESNMGKVKVNYVYEDGTPLDDSIILQGTIGSGYSTVPSASISDVYEVASVNGDTSGVFEEGTKEVTYYYTDYVPESILNADFDDDGEITIDDITQMQKYLADFIDLSDDKIANFDLNYNGYNDIDDCTMLQKYLTGYAVSTGTVTVNYYYTDENGDLQNLTTPQVYTGRVGTEYSAPAFKVVGYAVDETKLPDNADGLIPYGSSEVNFYYTASSLDINLHFMHTSASWNPSIWIWGSDLKGVDSDNYTVSGVWPGDTATDDDGDGWYDYSFTYKGAGTYNVIVSNNGNTQTIDYKGFVDNEMWIVINDSALTTGEFLTFYTDNPLTNPDAPIASQVTLS